MKGKDSLFLKIEENLKRISPYGASVLLVGQNDNLIFLEPV